jgi:Spy/CpxP family protein refolding chaperone
MNKLLAVIAAATLTLPTFTAEGDQPRPAGDQPRPPSAEGDGDNNRERGREGWQRRLVEENPELKGVDLQSPEGQEKLRAVMQKRMEAEAPRIRQRMAENQAAQHAELNKQLGMAPEEFDAIKPLLVRVENLRMQKGLVDNVGRPPGMGRGGPGGNNRNRGFFNPQMLLGDTQLDPSVQEIQDASKALKALIDDKQANAAEMSSAVAKLRKARQGFDAVFAKAQEELRSVLTPQQEAILVDNGTLD